MTDPDRLAVMAEQRARDLLRAHRTLDQADIATMGKDNALTVPERVALLIDEIERLRGLIAESCGCIST